MTERYEYENDDTETAQDLVTWRRMTSWELRRLAQEVEKTRLPWWTPYLMTLIAGLIAGYIGIVHNQVLSNRSEIQRIAAIQYQRSSLAPDIEDLKRRLLASEQMVQRVPAMEGRLVDIGQKIDRLYQLLYERRGDAMPPREDVR